MVNLRYDAPHPMPRSRHKRRVATLSKADLNERGIALFDLDGTLTTRDTFLPFLWFYARRQRKVWPLLVSPFVIAAYLLKLITDRSAKQLMIKAFVGGDQELTVESEAFEFTRRWVTQHLNDLGMEKLREHQGGGDRVIMVSASPDIYVPIIARELGIHEVLCTKVQRHEGRVLGSIVGPNCKRQAKVEFLTAHLNADQPPAKSYAYGDSRHDLPMLRWVKHGFLIRSNQLQPVEKQP